MKSAPLTLPAQTEGAAQDLKSKPGTVTTSFDRGELLLVNGRGKSFRLRWNGDEEQSEQALALPPGKYKLMTYRIVREQDGERWHISATRAPIKTIQVQAETNTRVEINDSILMSSSLRGKHAIMSIKGDGGSGLSIYRGEKRIPIGYRIESKSGRLLSSGKMNYG